jgi:hypothetical protein
MDAAPESIDGVWRQTCTVTEIGDAAVTGLWHGAVEYANGSGGGGEDRAPEIRFEFGTRQKHLWRGLGHIGDGAPEGDGVRNLGGLINVTENPVAINGVDVDVGVYEWSERHWKSNSSLTPAYKRILLNAVGSVNSDAFRNFQPGEVKSGAIFGGPTDSGYADLQFRFDAIATIPAGHIIERPAPNLPITITKAQEGWDLLHWDYKDTYVNGVGIVPVIAGAHLDRVHPRTKFADLGIGS